MRTRTSAFVVGLMVAGGFAVRAARADLEAFVESGDRVTGDLRSGGETDTYRLTGASGDVVEAVVRANHSVTVNLLDSGGSVLATDSGRSVHVVSSALSAAGPVSIQVVASSATSGKTRYTAALTCGDETSDLHLDLREATIGAHTTSVEADLIGRDGGDVAAESVAGIGSAAAHFAPGAVRKSKAFVIGATADLQPAGLTAVGPAVFFGPVPQFFALGSGVQIDLPYNTAGVGLTPIVLVAGLNGRTSTVRNVTVDTLNSVVRFPATKFGIYQVFDGTSAIGPVTGASLTISDAIDLDQMSSVAMKNGRMVVGVMSHVETIGGQPANHGAAYVFELSGSTWTQVAKLQPADLSTVAGFGNAVALDGDRLVVSGAGSTPNVWVFDRVGGTWTETASLTGGFQFGTSLALQGDRLAVGDPMFRGSVTVYDFDGTNWIADDPISPGPTSFGQSIALDGDRVLVGTPGNGGRGYAYTFVKVGGTWLQESQFSAQSGSSLDLFGWSVALQGDRALIGAWNERATPGVEGAAYVFERVSGLWTQVARIDNPNGTSNDHFGSCVALDGTRAMIGAPLSNLVGAESGAAYLAQRGTGNWTSIQAILPSGMGIGDHVGAALALDGTTTAIVASGEDDAATNAGVVHILDISGR